MMRPMSLGPGPVSSFGHHSFAKDWSTVVIGGMLFAARCSLRTAMAAAPSMTLAWPVVAGEEPGKTSAVARTATAAMIARRRSPRLVGGWYIVFTALSDRSQLGQQLVEACGSSSLCAQVSQCRCPEGLRCGAYSH